VSNDARTARRFAHRSPPQVGVPDRTGKILHVKGDDGSPPCVVQWNNNTRSESARRDHHAGHSALESAFAIAAQQR
jgi:hypothetical protein